MSDLAPALAIIGMFLSVAWVIRVFLGVRKETRIAELQAELHAKVLARCDGNEELKSYFASDLSQALLTSSVTERGVTLHKILSSMRTAVVVTAFSVGSLLLRNQIQDQDGREGFLIFGGLGLALGIGFLLASALSYFFSRNWGLLGTSNDQV
jgi:hypothetical protein